MRERERGVVQWWKSEAGNEVISPRILAILSEPTFTSKNIGLTCVLSPFGSPPLPRSSPIWWFLPKIEGILVKL